jgi:hypothetical protein
LMTTAFEEHLEEVNAWLKKRVDISVCRLGYKRVVHDPVGSSEAIRDFLSLDLNVEAMAQQVDLSLYRNRRS